MNITNLLTTKKTKIILILVGVSIILAIVFTFTRDISSNVPYYNISVPNIVENSKPAVPQPNISIKDKTQVSSNLSFDNIPKSDFIYQYQSQKIDEQLVSKLITDFNLKITGDKNNPLNGRTIKASSDNEYLVAFMDKNILDYSRDASVDTKKISKSDEELINVIRNFAPKFGIDMSNYKLQSQTYLLKETNHTQRIQDRNLAHIIEFYFVSSLGQKEVIDSTDSAKGNYIQVWIDGSSQILKFHIEYTGKYEQTPFAKVDLKNKEETIQAINAGQAILLDGPYSYEPGKPAILTITDIEVAYKVDQDKLFPIYSLTANIVNEDQSTTTGYLVLDAIKRN